MTEGNYTKCKSKATPALGRKVPGFTRRLVPPGGGALMSRSLCKCPRRRLRGEQSKTAPTDSDLCPSAQTDQLWANPRIRRAILQYNTGETYLGRSFLDGLLASFLAAHPPIGRATSVTCAADEVGTLDVRQWRLPRTGNAALRSWCATRNTSAFSVMQHGPSSFTSNAA